MPTDLYINSQAQASASLVRSEKYPQPGLVSDLIKNNKVQFTAYLVDGKGGFDALSGSPDWTAKLSIGPSSGGSAWSTVTFSSVTVASGTGTWQGTLDLTAATIAKAIGSLPGLKALLEFEITEDSSGDTQTVMQQEVEVLNRVIS